MAERRVRETASGSGECRRSRVANRSGFAPGRAFGSCAARPSESRCAPTSNASARRTRRGRAPPPARTCAPSSARWWLRRGARPPLRGARAAVAALHLPDPTRRSALGGCFAPTPAASTERACGGRAPPPARSDASSSVRCLRRANLDHLCPAHAPRLRPSLGPNLRAVERSMVAPRGPRARLRGAHAAVAARHPRDPHAPSRSRSLLRADGGRPSPARRRRSRRFAGPMRRALGGPLGRENRPRPERVRRRPASNRPARSSACSP